MENNKEKESSPLQRHEEGVYSSEEIIDHAITHLKDNPKLKNLTEDQLKEAVSYIVHLRAELYSETSFSGPLPHPNILKGYEEILKGSADRVITMAENNAENRIDINNRVVDSDIDRSKLGQKLGFALSVLFILAACFSVYMNSPWAASILGVGGFSSIISIFVLGKK